MIVERFSEVQEENKYDKSYSGSVCSVLQDLNGLPDHPSRHFMSGRSNDVYVHPEEHVSGLYSIDCSCCSNNNNNNSYIESLGDQIYSPSSRSEPATSDGGSSISSCASLDALSPISMLETFETQLTTSGSSSDIEYSNESSCQIQFPAQDGCESFNSHPFEGVEKRFIIKFNESVFKNDGISLLKISVEEWNAMLVPCGCKILSTLKSDSQEAVLYLLSESTLLVEPCRITIKTCGTTRPLFIVDNLVEYFESGSVESHTEESFDENYQTRYPAPSCSKYLNHVLFSREDYLFPKQQRYPHRSEAEEEKFLKPYFPEGQCLSVSTSESGRFKAFVGWSESGIDRTEAGASDLQLTEIAMRGIYADCVERFAGQKSICKGDNQNSAVKTILKSMSEFSAEEGSNKEFKIDEFWFDPCGYSANAFTAQSDYVDIHIAPEPDVSYASFETSAPICSLITKQAGSKYSPIQKLIYTFGAISLNVSIISSRENLLDDHPDANWIAEFAPLQLAQFSQTPCGALFITRLEFML